jgi:hypothetical protein
MSQTTIAPVLQAFVQTLRSNPSVVPSPGGIHEGLAPLGTAYPFLVYQLHYSPIDYDWSSVTTRIGIDCIVHTRDQVEGRTLDQSVMDRLQNAVFDFSATEAGDSGQSTLYCRRVLDLSSVDLDDEGKKLYMVGAQYEIWIDQPQ